MVQRRVSVTTITRKTFFISDKEMEKIVREHLGLREGRLDFEWQEFGGVTVTCEESETTDEHNTDL